MKRITVIIAAVVFSLLTFTACGKYEFSGSPDVSGKIFTVHAEAAKPGDYFISGSLEVEDSEQITIISSLAKGVIAIDLIRAPEEQSIEELPNYDEAESYKYEFSSTDSMSDSVLSGSYLVKAACLKKATGTIQIEVKPAE